MTQCRSRSRSSDLVAAVLMRPVGAAVHIRKGTVHRGLVRWLVVGSVPMAFLGGLLQDIGVMALHQALGPAYEAVLAAARADHRLLLQHEVAMLGLQDEWWALVVVYPTFTIPFGTWLLMGFFKTVPMEMEEAARVDGCGYLGAFLRVVLPVSLPGVLTAVIFAFTLSMQDFLYGLAFVAPGDQKPVPVGVPTELIRGDVYYWGSLMGAALLVGLPVAVLYNFFLDRFIQGITGGVGK